MMKKHFHADVMKSPERGFTLLETLVAVAILALAVSGPLLVASRTIVAAQAASDQLIASYLAQEGIEYVEMMRGDEFLSFYRANAPNTSTAAWNDFLNGSSASSITDCRSSVCTLDPTRTMGTGTGLSLVPCSGNSCTPLYISGGTYTQTVSSTPTPFTRTIQAITVSANEERIVSTVTWSSHGVVHTEAVTDHLTAWQ